MAHHQHRSSGPDGADDTAQRLAQGLGWFSIGLGLAEVVAPQSLARVLGMEEHTGLIRAYGVREIATGAGILLQDDPTPWIWARVGGDALDLATLATGLEEGNPKKGNVTLALAAVAGVTPCAAPPATSRPRGTCASRQRCGRTRAGDLLGAACIRTGRPAAAAAPSVPGRKLTQIMAAIRRRVTIGPVCCRGPFGEGPARSCQ